MAEQYARVEEILLSRQPQLPVYCIYPHAHREAARHFLSGFLGAYSLSGRTDFNGFFSDDIVEITATESLPPAA